MRATFVAQHNVYIVRLIHTAAWIACVIYSTIPAFWLLIHPRAEYWRSCLRSPYKMLLPLWIGMWATVAAISAPWRSLALYEVRWTWIPAALLFSAGIILYQLSRRHFTLSQFAGLPEIRPNHSQQRLATAGIRARVRHPVYLGHLCEMLAWSMGTGLTACWGLTIVATLTGALMIEIEDKELEKRFQDEFRKYRATVPALLPNLRAHPPRPPR
jgi:protein-S-isoprenylcysteine O-methyltransferase Ste14